MIPVSKKQLVIKFGALFLFLLFSCTKDESPTGPSNIIDHDIVMPINSVFNPDHVTDYVENRFESGYAWRLRPKYIDYMGTAVVSVNPANYSAGVEVGVQITIVFSEDIDPATIDESSIIFDPEVDGTLSYSDRIAIFTPSVDLIYNTFYTVTILNSVSDMAGNRMFDNYSWRFTTIVGPSPTLRGYYIGRYYVTEDYSSSTGSITNYANVGWTFTDYGHSCSTAIAENQGLNLCSFTGNYMVDNQLVFSNTHKAAIEVCDDQYMPTGDFSMQWIFVEDGNDTLVIQQLDSQNDVYIQAILEKQEPLYNTGQDVSHRKGLTFGW